MLSRRQTVGRHIWWHGFYSGGISVGWALLMAALLAAFVAGCVTAHGAGGGGVSSPKPPAAPSGEFAIVGWLAGVSLSIGVLTAILSFWVPLIPIKGSISCVVLSVALFALKYALDRWLHVAVNVGIAIAAVGAAVALFPLLHTWVNAHLASVARKLENVNPHAAGILKEVADGGTNLLDRLSNRPRTGVSP